MMNGSALPNTKSWKKEYLRILLNGPSGKKDYQLARELIDAGYADGKCRISHRREDHGTVLDIVWQGMNTNGRLFADKLKTMIHRQSWWFRIKTFGIWLFGVAAGFSMDVAKIWIQCDFF